MAYATVDQFIAMFGEDEAIALSNLDDPNQVELREEPIERAIDDASALIDGYLRSANYTLPLSEAPSVLQRAASDIARYLLDRLRTREDVKARYETWLKWLSDLAKGNVRLNTGEIPPTQEDAVGPAEFWSEESVFTFKNLRCY